MNKPLHTDDTMQELWAIKAETAERFQTAEQYFAHLGLKQNQQITKRSKKSVASAGLSIVLKRQQNPSRLVLA